MEGLTTSIVALSNNTFMIWALFAIGILLVIKGGDWFVDAASEIAVKLNIPAFIIGATIVSVATTLPEMLVSAIAAGKGTEGSVDMAVGNAVGSVTANTAMILAIGMLAMTFVCPRKKYLKQMLLLIASSAVLFIFSIPDRLKIIGSIILFIIFAAFMTINVIEARKEEQEAEEEGEIEKKGIAGNVIMFLIGAGAVVGGSELMVNFGEKIALSLHVPERIIAVTLIAVGTSLPELVTTITAIVKKNSSLSVGNIIGANIIDLTLILPLCSIISKQELPVTGNCINVDLPICMIVTLVAMVPLIIKQKDSKITGVILLLLYAGYLAVTIANPEVAII